MLGITSESITSVGQLRTEVRGGLLSSFSNTSDNLHCVGQTALSIGAVGVKKGCVIEVGGDL